jgi:predicted DNA-binding transcriptional regulator AlpA
VKKEVDNRLLRLKQILELIPISKTTFYEGVRQGRFPSPVKLGRCSFWRKEDIENIIEEMIEKSEQK